MMTQEKLEKLIARRLMKTLGVKRSAAIRAATDIRTSLDVAMDLDVDDTDLGDDAPDDAPHLQPLAVSAGLNNAPDPSDRRAVMPTSPSVTEAGPPPASSMSQGPQLIVVPGYRDIESISKTGKIPERPGDVVFAVSDEEAAAIDKSAREQARAAGGGQPDPEYWSLEQIIALLEKNTQPSISIRDGSMRLKRNIQAVVGAKCVKLIYFHEKIAQGSAAEKGQAARLGMTAFVDFYQSERRLRVTEGIEQVTKMAEAIFGPRQQEVVSHTPIKTGGNLTVDLGGDPHTETDKQWYKGREV